MAQNLRKITLPIPNGNSATTTYEIPQNFGSFKVLEWDTESDDISIDEEQFWQFKLLSGLTNDSFISLQLALGEKQQQTSSVLLHYTGTRLEVLSNSNILKSEDNQMPLSMWIINGDLIAQCDHRDNSSSKLQGTVFLIGEQNSSISPSDISSNVINLDKIIKNSIAIGDSAPSSRTPGQVYIQIG